MVHVVYQRRPNIPAFSGHSFTRFPPCSCSVVCVCRFMKYDDADDSTIIDFFLCVLFRHRVPCANHRIARSAQVLSMRFAVANRLWSREKPHPDLHFATPTQSFFSMHPAKMGQRNGIAGKDDLLKSIFKEIISAFLGSLCDRLLTNFRMLLWWER